LEDEFEAPVDPFNGIIQLDQTDTPHKVEKMEALLDIQSKKLSSMKDQYNAAFSEMRKAVADSRNELLSKRSKKLLGTTHSHSHSFTHVHTLTKTYKKQMKVTKHLKHSVGKVKKNQAELRSKLKYQSKQK